MNMSTFCTTLLLLVLLQVPCEQQSSALQAPNPTAPAPAPAPAPDKILLDASVEVIQIEVTVESVERSTARYDGAELDTTEKVLRERTKEANAGLLTATSDFEIRQVDAFKTPDFNIAKVQKIADSKYLIQGPPGKYLVVVNVNQLNKYLNLEIPGSVDDPDQPDEPDVPVDPPVGEFGELAKLAVQLAIGMEDELTRQALLSELGKANLFSLTAEEITFDQARATVQQAIIAAMKTRSLDRLDKDWFAGFRTPIENAFEKAGVDTKQEYVKAWADIFAALSTAIKTVPPTMKALPPTTKATPSSKQPQWQKVRVQYCVPGQPCEFRDEWRLVP